MNISVFDLFTIGIGPSSSHTVGPMRAAYRFVTELESLENIHRIQIDLYGSLALTGKGHGTDKAVLLGIEGQTPEGVDPDQVTPRFNVIVETQQWNIRQERVIHFDLKTDLLFHYKESLPAHANGMTFSAFNSNGTVLSQKTFYSVGGGFIVTETELTAPQTNTAEKKLPYPFDTARTLIETCRREKITIAELMLRNEATWQPHDVVRQKLLHIAAVMDECIEKGCHHPGVLPGGLKVRRRAPALYEKLSARTTTPNTAETMNWLNIYALAVNEENAAGSRVVTAPTNGAAGIIPAVLKYYKVFCENPTDEGVINYLLTAGAIAILYKKGASISAAEVGCQGEVGVACSMAAGALTAALGGSLGQIEKAAEIGMEHHLGLACDPIGGLVQIPCIERNAMASVKAVNIAHLVMAEDEQHRVSLDEVIQAMFLIGKKMNAEIKETSTGGLAVTVNQAEC